MNDLLSILRLYYRGQMTLDQLSTAHECDAQALIAKHEALPADEQRSIMAQADALRGVATFFCSCPSGEHGGFFQLEAAGPDDALGLLPERLRATTRVSSGETMAF